LDGSEKSEGVLKRLRGAESSGWLNYFVFQSLALGGIIRQTKLPEDVGVKMVYNRPPNNTPYFYTNQRDIS
jgi:hypothetical protein